MFHVITFRFSNDAGLLRNHFIHIMRDVTNGKCGNFANIRFLLLICHIWGLKSNGTKTYVSEVTV